MTVHVNSIKVTSPPHSHLANFDPPPPKAPQVDKDVTYHFRTPWIHKFVIVTKKGHPMKGSYAKVVDAIPPEKPRPEKPISEPHLVVQYERISPTGPQRERLPYGYVVDAVYVPHVVPWNQMLTPCSSGTKLVPVSDKEHPFWFETSQPQMDMSSTLHGQPTLNVGSTPAWTPSSIDASLSPAWNPSAATPFVPLSLSPAWSPSSFRVDSSNETRTSTSGDLQHMSATVPTTARSPPTHPLLDPRLVGKMLRVSVSGGAHPKKETPVSVVLGQNEVTIQQSWRSDTFGLLPEWVTPRHPNPTRDNGLLVVIRGDHCGKYVRRIHHRYVNDARDHPVMQLAVVERVDGIETITEEQVEISPDDLCQGFETDQEKKLNAKLMTSLREKARYPQPS